MSKAKPTFVRRTITPEDLAAAEATASMAALGKGPTTTGAPAAAPVVTLVPTGHAPDAQSDFGARQSLPDTPVEPWQELAVGSVVDVPLSRIRSNPMNPRAIYRISAIDELAKSIQENGQLVPALAFVDPETLHVVLIEGETRFRAVTAISLPTLRVLIQERPADDRQLYEIARAVNVARNDQTIFDDAVKWKVALERKLYSSQEALGDSMKPRVHYSTVNRTIKLADIPETLMMEIIEHEELMSLRMLDALRLYWVTHGVSATLDLIARVVEEGLAYRDVLELRGPEGGAPSRKEVRRRASFDKIRVQYHGGAGSLRVFEDGRIELSVENLSTEAREKLRHRLEAIMREETEGDLGTDAGLASSAGQAG